MKYDYAVLACLKRKGSVTNLQETCLKLVLKCFLCKILCRKKIADVPLKNILHSFWLLTKRYVVVLIVICFTVLFSFKGFVNTVTRNFLLQEGTFF